MPTRPSSPPPTRHSRASPGRSRSRMTTRSSTTPSPCGWWSPEPAPPPVEAPSVPPPPPPSAPIPPPPSMAPPLPPPPPSLAPPPPPMAEAKLAAAKPDYLTEQPSIGGGEGTREPLEVPPTPPPGAGGQDCRQEVRPERREEGRRCERLPGLDRGRAPRGAGRRRLLRVHEVLEDAARSRVGTACAKRAGTDGHPDRPPLRDGRRGQRRAHGRADGARHLRDGHAARGQGARRSRRRRGRGCPDRGGDRRREVEAGDAEDLPRPEGHRARARRRHARRGLADQGPEPRGHAPERRDRRDAGGGEGGPARADTGGRSRHPHGGGPQGLGHRQRGKRHGQADGPARRPAADGVGRSPEERPGRRPCGHLRPRLRSVAAGQRGAVLGTAGARADGEPDGAGGGGPGLLQRRGHAERRGPRADAGDGVDDVRALRADARVRLDVRAALLRRPRDRVPDGGPRVRGERGGALPRPRRKGGRRRPPPSAPPGSPLP